MNESAHAPPCGLYCGVCSFLENPCAGCGNVMGKPFWTERLPGCACPIYDCCLNVRKLEHCGLCGEFPCKTFSELRDPNLSDDEFAASLEERNDNLQTRKNIGKRKWLEEMARMNKN
jgi:hypothetical protein